MKLTKKSTTTKVETTELVCEICKDEFEKLCAETAAKTIVRFVGADPDIDDFMAGVQLTSLFADFAASITSEMFNDTDKTENPDNNEKEEK